MACIGQSPPPSALGPILGYWAGKRSFIHTDVPDRLVQLAIVHAEFESLHPFLDGDSRIGRMVLPLFLWQAGILRMPYFYLSAYFEANKERDGDNRATHGGLLASVLAQRWW